MLLLLCPSLGVWNAPLHLTSTLYVLLSRCLMMTSHVVRIADTCRVNERTKRCTVRLNAHTYMGAVFEVYQVH